jgi:hypothetical protein
MARKHTVDPSAAQEWVQNATTRGFIAGGRLAENVLAEGSELLFPSSLAKVGADTLIMARLEGRPVLAVFGPNKAGFKGVKIKQAAITLCPYGPRNSEKLRSLLPFTAPSPLRNQPVVVGVGDRLGLASAGHLRLFARYDAAPVLAQQSVRELDLTARDYEDVMNSATWAVFQEGYKRPWGADGDHLKTPQWVRKAVKLGYCMITADVSDSIHGEWAEAPEAEVEKAYEALEQGRRGELEDRYLSLVVDLDTGETVNFSRIELARIVLVYDEALDYAVQLYEAGTSADGNFDFELSIDETMTPTSPAAHVFVASEMKSRGIPLYSMAPRFIGEFQKGIDYIGEAREFERSFRTHAAIARRFGYRISVHSGSDKFTVFPIVGKQTRSFFHLKTAGTNWLQALEVIAQKEPSFFRHLWDMAQQVFPKARQYYHITPNMDNLPDVSSLDDAGLLELLENQDSRQILHVTYGELLRNQTLGERIYEILEQNIEAYWESLDRHIGRHLETLGVRRK